MSFCVTRKQVGLGLPTVLINVDRLVIAKQMIAQGSGGKLIAACSNAAYRPVRTNGLTGVKVKIDRAHRLRTHWLTALASGESEASHRAVR